MKAIFIDKYGKVVWECTKDANYEIANGTKAIKKGATCGKLINGSGQVIQIASYNTAA